MSVLFDIFSTRELALIIWLIILFLVLIIWDEGRYHLKNISKSAFAPRILISYVYLIIYISAIVALLWKLGFWSIFLIKDTIIWFLFSALGIFFSLNKVKDARYFGGLIKGNITIIAIIQFLVNLYPFSLLTELIALPCLVFLVILNAYSEYSGKTNTAFPISGTIIGVIFINLRQ